MDYDNLEYVLDDRVLNDIKDIVYNSNLSEKKIIQCKTGDEILTINPLTSKLEPNKINKIWFNGTKKSYKIILKNRHEIICTENHKFYKGIFRNVNYKIKNTWLKKKELNNYEEIILKDLKINDSIAIINNQLDYLDYTKNKELINLYETIGYILGDGNISTKYQINITSNYRDIIERLINITPFKNEIYLKINPSGEHKYKKLRGIYKNKLIQKLTQMNLMKNKSETKFIPLEILNSNNFYYFLAILNGLINTDGTINNNGIVFDTKSHNLFLDTNYLKNKGLSPLPISSVEIIRIETISVKKSIVKMRRGVNGLGKYFFNAHAL